MTYLTERIFGQKTSATYPGQKCRPFQPNGPFCQTITSSKRHSRSNDFFGKMTLLTVCPFCLNEIFGRKALLPNVIFGQGTMFFVVCPFRIFGRMTFGQTALPGWPKHSSWKFIKTHPCKFRTTSGGNRKEFPKDFSKNFPWKFSRIFRRNPKKSCWNQIFEWLEAVWPNIMRLNATRPKVVWPNISFTRINWPYRHTDENVIRPNRSISPNESYDRKCLLLNRSYGQKCRSVYQMSFSAK